MLSNKFSEEDLILGIQEGNKHLFAFLFKTYFSSLSAYAATIVKHSFLAEEIVQETFIKIWESRQQLHIKISLRSYLFRCVHNNCINYLKSTKVSLKHDDEFKKEVAYHIELATLNFSEEILDNLISEEMEASFERKINELPDQCREIFVLSRYDQFTYLEIAQKLNISINTVKTQISRALDKLRDSFLKK